MKAHALVPALLLAAALVAPPAADAQGRHRSDRGRRPPAHGYYGHRPSHRPSYGYHYRAPRPYYRPYRHYPAPYGNYGYGYGYGYGGYGYGYPYGYGYYPPPPPRYCPPRPRIGVWFGF